MANPEIKIVMILILVFIAFAVYWFLLKEETPSGSTATPSGSTETPSGSTATPSGSTETPSGSTATPSGSTETPSGSTATPDNCTTVCNDKMYEYLVDRVDEEPYWHNFVTSDFTECDGCTPLRVWRHGSPYIGEVYVDLDSSRTWEATREEHTMVYNALKYT